MKTNWMLKLLSLWALTACKILPGTNNSEARNTEIFKLLDDSSIKFTRVQNGTSGELNFQLKDKHNCRVEYWADDPTGRPAPSSPMVVDCPSNGSSAAVKVPIENIVSGIPLTFRIHVWPRTLTFLASLSLDFKENRDLSKIQANYVIISRYMSPRNSNEIYTFQFAKETPLSEVRASLQFKGGPGEQLCTEEDSDEEISFPRYRSQPDKKNRPLHGLGAISTAGYGQDGTTVHPFFNTRLMQFYKTIDRQQNWKWNFEWEGKKYNFETFPPGYMASVNFIDGDKRVAVQNRSLGNALAVIDIANSSLTMAPVLLYAPEIGVYHLTIKTADAAKTVLRCDFAPDQRELAVPSRYIEKLASGEYLVTLALETSQIHYKEGAAYPPWLITAHDWIHFKINKKM